MKITLRKLTVALSLVMFLLFPAFTRAQTAVQAWVQRYNGPGNSGNSGDFANAVAVDSSNNVIVTGYSMGSGGYDGYATIKYSSAGVPLWTNRYDGPGNYDDTASAVAVDNSNNVIVTGSSGPSGATYADWLTIKYSSAGVSLWTNRYNGTGNDDDSASAVAVDSSNNVIVTGWSYASGAMYADWLTIKYSSAGVPLWTNRYSGPENYDDFANAVAVDSSNNVIVTGSSVSSESGADYLTIKYSSVGVPLWTNRYDGPGNYDDSANAVAVDNSNNVIVTGGSYSEATLYHMNYATIKYSSAGVPLWTNRYNGPVNGDDFASAVAVDSSNSVIVTGYSASSTVLPYNRDYLTIKYSSAGVPLWINRYNGTGNSSDVPTAVVVDRSDNVMVTGYSMGSGSGWDYLTISYSSAGVPLWTNRYNGPGNYNDLAYAMAVDRNGNVIVAGGSVSSGYNYDFATIKYVCAPSPVMANMIWISNTFQMQVDDLVQSGTLVIEASTNLTKWAPVFTNTTPTNVLYYTDPAASNSPTRFYRAFQFP